MTTPHVFRAGAPANLATLRSLRELPGRWMGKGFNLISRPDKHDEQPFFLQLSATQETIEFAPIGAPVPNRGSAQDDIFFRGVHYTQQIADAATGGALHFETGMWLDVPATTAPAAPETVTRLATIPHGDALLAQGKPLAVPGGPRIDPVDSTPITTSTGKPVTDDKYLAPFKNTALPVGIPAEAVLNPNVLLTDAIKGQKITETVVLPLSTTDAIGGTAGGIQNIPFVVANANATSMTAVFWIEKVEDPVLGHFLQLQYTQTIILRFLGIDWPHINVATLIKQ
ncbi:heme-binding protein [Amycolatopsis sp. NPDC051373]|uniref:heme-binding protein n=1 Tax=Amycolatopsis sp. NPDC051373 TaxID=3155801 RepID=UPI00344E52A8